MTAGTAPTRALTRDNAPATNPFAPVLLWLREFPGTPRAVGDSRHWLARILPPCDARDTLVLVADELAANAVEHTRSGILGGSFGVHVAWSPGEVRVTVADQGSPTAPSVAAATLEAERMRGLHIVQCLTSAWGCSGGDRGRWVWADIPWSSQGGPERVAPVDALPTAEAVRLLRLRCPKITVGYGGSPPQWWAHQPAASEPANRVSAPCFGALSDLAMATWPPSRSSVPRPGTARPIQEGGT